MTTIEMTTIHPVERLAHRVGSLLVRWSVARAERRDRALALRHRTTVRVHAVLDHEESRARVARERTWQLRGSEAPRLR